MYGYTRVTIREYVNLNPSGLIDTCLRDMGKEWSETLSRTEREIS